MSKSTSKTSHQVRIIGGVYKRTPLFVPDLLGLRPTPDRVRETLFNWLSVIWDGQFLDKKVLDLFAGTAALSFEALSRGVEHADIVEKNKQAIHSIEKSRAKLALKNCRVFHEDALHWLENFGFQPSYDLIFLDPPFESDLLVKVLPRLSLLQSTNGLLYIESPTKIDEIQGYASLRSGRAGAVFYELFQRSQ